MSERRPTVVQFGAGAIGRGFLGQLWTEGGYEVVFVDVNADLVAALNASGSYPLRLIGTASEETLTIAPLRAISASDPASVGSAVADCAFAATAVGIDHLTDVAERLLAPGIAARRAAAAGRGPLNILCCENGASAPEQLTAALRRAAVPETAFSVAPTVVGRMVPPPGMRDPGKPLLVAGEPFKRLPFLATGWLGSLPDVPGMVPVRSAEAWELEERRKLFTHNGGHAVLAYLGMRAGHEYIWQAAEDPEITPTLCGFWAEVDAALAASAAPTGEFDSTYQQRHEEDLLHRFRSRALGDTVARVGRDPARKLRPDDRLVGAALFCLGQGIEPRHAARAIAAALRFNAPADPSAPEVRAALREGGIAGALQRLAGLPADHTLTRLVVDEASTGSD